jgi:hypothetical protein
MITAEPAPPVPAAAAASRRRELAPWCLLLGGAAACLGYLAAEWATLGGRFGLPLDDSWIHLQFARNLAAGLGLSYNPGELVTGSTAPLWTALLALLAALPGNPLAWAQAAGIVLYLCGVDATWRLARELGLSRGLAALCGVLTLGTGWLVWSALSGMEVPLFVALSLWGMILHLREREADRRRLAAAEQGVALPPDTAPVEPLAPIAAMAPIAAGAPMAAGDRGGRAAPWPLAPAVLALAALARPEGLLLLVLAFADRCLVVERPAAAGPLRWRRPPFAALLGGALLAACVLVGPLLFYRVAGGSFLPTTFGAKGGQAPKLLPELQYVYVVLGIFLRPQPYMTLLAGGGVAALVARLGTRRDRSLLPGLWLLALPLAYSLISPEGPKLLAGNFGRYYFPLFPVVVVAGALGLEAAAAALRPGIAAGRFRLPVTLVLAALLVWPTATELWRRAAFYTLNLANVEQSDVRAARWLAARLPPEAVLAVNDIGAFKYLLPNRVIDLAGIANPELRQEVAQLTGAGMTFEKAMAVAVERRRPDYIVIFPSWLPHLAEYLGLRPLLSVRIGGNVTMGSDLLIVYATPWTRVRLRGVDQPGAPGGAGNQGIQ